MTSRLPVVPAVRATADGAYLDALFERRFTDEQRAVVVAPLDPRLVVAGAGSGKTTVMAARVVHAVACYRLMPGAVLGLTFTTKAAGELRVRVRRALELLHQYGGPAGALVDEALVDDVPTVSTYHAYAASLVRDHALRLGREPDARQLTDADAWQVVTAVLRARREPFQHLDWQLRHTAELVLALDAEMAEHGVSVEQVRREDERLVAWTATATKATKPVADVASTAHKRSELLEVVAAYRARKQELDLLDFADQIALAGDVAAAAPEVGAAERDRYGLVLLDEYQDTSVGQRVLLTHLFGDGHPVTAVGDPCQAIYGWRGASVGNLLRFPEHFPRRGTAGPVHAYPPDYLLTSFRNGGRILALANTLSAAVRTPAPETSRRPHVEVPRLAAAAGAENAGEVHAAWHLHVEDEAAWVTDGLLAARADGTAWGEMAVLCRMRSLFPSIHRALAERGVPVEVVGLGGLLEMPEVADVVAVLRLLADPLANPSLLRLLTGPRYRIGPRDLAALGRRAAHLAREGGVAEASTDPSDDPDGTAALRNSTAAVDPCDVVALTDALASLGPPAAYSPEAYERLSRLDDELTRLRPLLTQPVVEAVSVVVSRTGLDVELMADPDGLGAARAANLSAFADVAVRFQGVEAESDLPSFLDYLRAAAEREEGLEPAVVSTADTVKLMTVHKAKGLEWDVVAVPGMVQGDFPSKRGRAVWTNAPGTLPTRLRGDADDLPADPECSKAGIDAHKAAAKALDQREERRLAYVAVTRARRLVLLSGAVWNATAAKTPRSPGQFLVEASGVPDVVVGPWCAQPEPGETNPLVDRIGDVDFPRPVDAVARTRRETAAELVRAVAAQEQTLLPVGSRWREEAELLVAEIEAAAAPVRVPLPTSLTASQVVRLNDDPAGFAADLARPVPRRPSRAARRGTTFHTWLEQRLGERLLLDDDLPWAVDPEHPADAELAELQLAFERSEYADRTPVAVEAPFQVSVGGRVLRGRIDAVFDATSAPGAERRWEVVDWKTGSTDPDPLQLAVYRVAWARREGVDVGRVDAAFLDVPNARVIRPRDLPDADGLARLLAGAAG